MSKEGDEKTKSLEEYKVAAAALAAATNSIPDGNLVPPFAFNSAAMRLPFAASGVPYGGALTPGLDNNMAAALYQNPLWQAAIRQQQLQIFSQIASMNPFVQGGLQQSLATLPPSLATSLINNVASQGVDAVGRTTSSSSTVDNLSPITKQAPTEDVSKESFAAYRDYLAKLATFQASTTSNSSTSPLDTKTNVRHSLDHGKSSPQTLVSSPKILMSNGGGGGNNGGGGSGKSSIIKPDTGNLSEVPHTTTPSTTVAKRSSRDSNQNGGGGREKVFTCKTCNRSFGYKHVLQNHERTHTGEKPFECKVCNKRFTRDHHLKTHMRLHTGEKPYSCTHCDRQFVQVANLRRHLRVHTGERPYKCELCDSCFSDSNQLKAHLLVHDGAKPFTCELCHHNFRRRHHLAHHVCSKKDDMILQPQDNSENDEHNEKIGLETFLKQQLKEPLITQQDPTVVHRQLKTEKNGSPLNEEGDKRRQRKSRDPKRCWPIKENGDEDDDQIDHDLVDNKKNGPFQSEPEDLSAPIPKQMKLSSTSPDSINQSSDTP